MPSYDSRLSRNIALAVWSLVISLSTGASLAQQPIPQPKPNTPTPAAAELPWVRIPAGTFTMGCVPGDAACDDDERPAHVVTLSRPLDVLATEVTLAQWRTSGRPLPEQPIWNTAATQPVVNVAWEDAKGFCAAVGGRLPTEAEWEYAARGGKAGLVYPWGNAVSHEEANYGTGDCCEGLVLGRDRWVETAPAGSFPPNGYGLYDMAGNVLEWVADGYDEGYYARSPATDPISPATGADAVVRGGAWNLDFRYLRVSYRSNWLVPSGPDSLGVRCVRDVSP